MKKGLSVLCAMSGGVDSAVAAALLAEKGYDTRGVTFLLSPCSDGKDASDAAAVSEAVGIPHEVLDRRSDFCDRVIRPFAESYIRGETPNPCIECNKNIKFKILFETAQVRGIDKIATGHYARIEFDAGSKRYLLKKGIDHSKDQSYVLYRLSQELLGSTLFPLGELTKRQVREYAGKHGFSNSDRADSQDICFIPDGDYPGFIRSFFGYKEEEGNFADTCGRILGRHHGHISYTVGQRKGLGISADRPLYVLDKDPDKNIVILGTDEDLYTRRVLCEDINLIALAAVGAGFYADVKIRYSQKTARARVTEADSGGAVIEFAEPQRAPAPGQSAVFYDGDIVIGGGKIVKERIAR